MPLEQQEPLAQQGLGLREDVLGGRLERRPGEADPRERLGVRGRFLGDRGRERGAQVHGQGRGVARGVAGLDDAQRVAHERGGASLAQPLGQLPERDRRGPDQAVRVAAQEPLLGLEQAFQLVRRAGRGRLVARGHRALQSEIVAEGVLHLDGQVGDVHPGAVERRHLRQVGRRVGALDRAGGAAEVERPHLADGIHVAHGVDVGRAPVRPQIALGGVRPRVAAQHLDAARVHGEEGGQVVDAAVEHQPVPARFVVVRDDLGDVERRLGGIVGAGLGIDLERVASFGGQAGQARRDVGVRSVAPEHLSERALDGAREAAAAADVEVGARAPFVGRRQERAQRVRVIVRRQQLVDVAGPVRRRGRKRRRWLEGEVARAVTVGDEPSHDRLAREREVEPQPPRPDGVRQLASIDEVRARAEPPVEPAGAGVRVGGAPPDEADERRDPRPPRDQDDRRPGIDRQAEAGRVADDDRHLRVPGRRVAEEVGGGAGAQQAGGARGVRRRVAQEPHRQLQLARRRLAGRHRRGDRVEPKVLGWYDPADVTGRRRRPAPELADVVARLGELEQQLPELPACGRLGGGRRPEVRVLRDRVQRLRDAGDDGADAAEAQQLPQGKCRASLEPGAQGQVGAPLVGEGDRLVAARAQRRQRAGHDLVAVFGQDPAAIAGLVAQPRAVDVQDHPPHVLAGAVGRGLRRGAHGAAAAALRKALEALAPRVFELAVDLVPGAILEQAGEAADGDRAAHLERELEVSVDLHPVAAEEAVLADVGVDGVGPQAHERGVPAPGHVVGGRDLADGGQQLAPVQRIAAAQIADLLAQEGVVAFAPEERVEQVEERRRRAARPLRPLAHRDREWRDRLGPDHGIDVAARRRVRIDLGERRPHHVPQARADEREGAPEPIDVVGEDRLLGAHDGADNRRGLGQDLRLGEIEDSLLGRVDGGGQEAHVRDPKRIGRGRIDQAEVVDDEVDVAQHVRVGAIEPAPHRRPGRGQRRRQPRGRLALHVLVRVREHGQHVAGAQQRLVGQAIRRRGQHRQRVEDRAQAQPAVEPRELAGHLVPSGEFIRQPGRGRGQRHEAALLGEEAQVLVPGRAIRGLGPHEDGPGRRRPTPAVVLRPASHPRWLPRGFP